jgi:putative SOS response-associated peptidase YedK
MSRERPAKPVIMARSETVARGALAASFTSRRCLLLADGFYEWHKSGKTSQPYLFRRAGGAPFGMAGLWQPTEDGPVLGACAVLTRAATGAMSHIHHRMPLVLDPSQHAAWLDPDNRDLPSLKTILLTARLSDFVGVRVSPHVGSPANDDPRCMAPLDEADRAGEQTELFTARQS